MLAAELEDMKETERQFVAELDGEVVAGLYALLIAPPQPGLDAVLDAARRLRGALDEPPQGTLKRRGNARLVTISLVHPQGE